MSKQRSLQGARDHETARFRPDADKWRGFLPFCRSCRAGPARRRRHAVPREGYSGQLRATAFRGRLEKAGWTTGNLQIDVQWGTGDAAWVHAAVERALKLSPEVLLANGDAAAHSALQLTSTVPVIFIGSGDPVADGLVQSISRPGGNVTGFAVMEPTLGAKLLSMLKQIAPRIARVGVLINPDNATHKHILRFLSAAAPGFAVSIEPAPARDRAEIEAAMSRLANASDCGRSCRPTPPPTRSASCSSNSPRVMACRPSLRCAPPSPMAA
jgi:putative ABC transport system substrate-binding protein